MINKISVIIPAFNAEKSISRLLSSIESQCLSENHYIEVIVVNDASTDSTTKVVGDFTFSNTLLTLRLTSHSINQGRSIALNTGISFASAQHCIIIDSDCWYEDVNIFQSFFTSFNNGVDVCFGFTTASAISFWGRYQNEVFTKRVLINKPEVQTTANFGFTKEAVISAGGFSCEYHHYGFEDKDLILNLLKLSPKINIAIRTDIIAIHNEHLNLHDISNKMYNSAKHSAPIFARNHPEAYIFSGYGKLDYEINKRSLIYPIYMFSELLPYIKTPCEKLLNMYLFPFYFKTLIVKTISALSFAKGCKDRGEYD